ncbi:MAG: hypothetical protein ACTHOH_09730 [Lysobacteraceae bacterium]
MTFVRPLAAALFACGLLSSHGADAQSRQAVASGLRNEAAPLTPAARGDLTRAFVAKWGGYVQRVYGTPVATWAQRMVPTFVAADPANFRTSLKRDTFEGALAQLTGTGHRLADADVVDRFARASSTRGLTTKTAAEIGAKVLGSTTGDLVFTAITPCRIVDTRVAGGAIGANGSRNFIGVAVSAGANFTSQGGSATDCGVAAIGASAIAINVTAVTPAGAGFATVYRSGDTRPLAASVNYTAGAIVNNSVVVGIPNPLSITDFSIYTFAQSDYVVDIVGYFSPPQATPLDCVSTGSPASYSIDPNSSNFFNNPACPAGYRAVTPYCWTAAVGVYSLGSGYNGNSAGAATFCAWRNTTASVQTVFGGNMCCRVPGR